MTRTSTAKAVAILTDKACYTAVGIDLCTTSHTDSIVELFGKRLGSQHIVPAGYINCLALLMYDLSTGVDGYTGQPLRIEGVGLPPLLYVLIENSLKSKEIITALFDEEFAVEVEKVLTDVAAEASP